MLNAPRVIGLIFGLITFNSVAQEPSPTATVAAAGSQKAFFGPQENFTGRVRVDPLFTADKQINVSAAYVTFEPGARSAWHTHPAGQRLIVTSGVGLTQQEGQPIQIIRPGDVVSCPAGVKHWHGATPDSAMTHLAVTGNVAGSNVEWMEKVTDEQYHAR
ncbi:Cupin domain [Serratia liquefaciens]|uniref:(R)-mandelonitrile lyase n=1 Tax=Serratia TaxID=613 RepID=UPI000EFA3203|nr:MULTISPECIES: cupin domain-containing protein [Serratia]AYO40760.1 cupin domain-containing protein [Serratia sp. P2ACOL2]QNQ56881.1 cupin domain-containing protein [Serratia liquefaciens]CAI0859372.1 Cupin domain [Serratia liquefaciens]CAI0865385.1 Cupin domain [Serratia liquefaciens]HEJ8087610.1 cupin domain-containing protein [Serratia liquefaciens]